MPRLIHLPGKLGEYAAEQQRTPFELRQETARLISRNLVPYTSAQAELVLSWCECACQADAGGKSILAITMDAATAGDDVFAKWKQDRLNGTLGPESQTQAQGQTQPPTRDQALLSQTLTLLNNQTV